MSPNLPTFILASASAARRRILQSVGIQPIVKVSNFDEDSIQLADPQQLVETLAISKANTIAQHLTFDHCLVMGCDSILWMDGQIQGKPPNGEVAIQRWQRMRGRSGIIYTGHAMIDPQKQQTLVRCGITKVFFGQISDPQIAAYVATGEPLKCAGGFALEGIGGLLIDRIEGCHTNVIGLSLPILRSLLADLGYSVI
jgi:septum formation protein